MLDVYGVLVYMVNRLATRCSRGDLILKGGTALNEKLKRELPGYFRATRYRLSCRKHRDLQRSVW